MTGKGLEEGNLEIEQKDGSWCPIGTSQFRTERSGMGLVPVTPPNLQQTIHFYLMCCEI